MLFNQPVIEDAALMNARDALILRPVMHVSTAKEFYFLAPRFGLDTKQAKQVLNDARCSLDLTAIKATALNLLTGNKKSFYKKELIIPALRYDLYNMSKSIEYVQSQQTFDPDFVTELESEAIKSIRPRLEGFLWRKVKFLCVNGVGHADWFQEASEIAALAVRWSWPFKKDNLYSGVAWTSARNWIINQIYHRTIPANNPYIRDQFGNSVCRWNTLSGDEDAGSIEDNPDTKIAYDQIIRKLSPQQREAIWLLSMDPLGNFDGLLTLIQKVHPEIEDCHEASEYHWYRQAVATFCRMSELELGSLLDVVGKQLAG